MNKLDQVIQIWPFCMKNKVSRIIKHNKIKSLRIILSTFIFKWASRRIPEIRRLILNGHSDKLLIDKDESQSQTVETLIEQQTLSWIGNDVRSLLKLFWISKLVILHQIRGIKPSFSRLEQCYLIYMNNVASFQRILHPTLKVIKTK